MFLAPSLWNIDVMRRRFGRASCICRRRPSLMTSTDRVPQTVRAPGDGGSFIPSASPRTATDKARALELSRQFDPEVLRPQYEPVLS
jgi:hypothetical protein